LISTTGLSSFPSMKSFFNLPNFEFILQRCLFLAELELPPQANPLAIVLIITLTSLVFFRGCSLCSCSGSRDTCSWWFPLPLPWKLLNSWIITSQLMFRGVWHLDFPRWKKMVCLANRLITRRYDRRVCWRWWGEIRRRGEFQLHKILRHSSH